MQDTELKHKTAIDWAASQGYRPMREISNQPWSVVTLCKDQSGKMAVLKANLGPKAAGLGWLQPFGDWSAGRMPKVLAANPDTGAALFEFIDVSASSGASARTLEVLQFYGTLQAHAAQHPDLLAMAPALQAEQILDQLSKMLAGRKYETPGNVFALIDAQARKGIATFFDRNWTYFDDCATLIDSAAKTINHTDLRRDNLLRREDGRLCLLDWDDGAVSAPGWSLHTLFAGTSRIYAALNNMPDTQDAAQSGTDIRSLNAYIDALTQFGGYERAQLIDLLPKAAIFGAFKYVTDMAPYDISDIAIKTVVCEMAVNLFSDMSRHMALREGKAVPPRSTGANAPMTTFPTVAYKPDSQGPDDEVARQGAALFHRFGALHISGVFPAALVDQALTEFRADRPQHDKDMQSGRALRVGDRRYMISLNTGATLGTPDMLAQPRLMAVMDHILGPRYLLGSATSVLALDGSGAQRWHRDNDPLFLEYPDLKVPPYSVAVLVPLVPIDELIGATEVIPGSHLNSALSEKTGPVVRPNVAVGDCYLMDSRLLHRGMANRSDRERPVLSLVYQRPWYRDYQNFTDQPALDMDRAKADAFPEAYRHIVEWAVR